MAEQKLTLDALRNRAKPPRGATGRTPTYAAQMADIKAGKIEFAEVLAFKDAKHAKAKANNMRQTLKKSGFNAEVFESIEHSGEWGVYIVPA